MFNVKILAVMREGSSYNNPKYWLKIFRFSIYRKLRAILVSAWFSNNYYSSNCV